MNPIHSRDERPRSARVLVVEDEALIADEIADRLRRRSYEVVGIADTGHDAVRQACVTRPDLILMDIRLKGAIDGIETAALVQEKIDVPIVFLTAHSDESTLARAREAAPYSYILKPLQERDMLAIDMALYRHSLEKRLRESEVRYQATLSSIGDAVIAVDLDGKVTYLNPAASELTGYEPFEAAGRFVEEVMPIFHEVSGQKLETPALRVLRSKTRFFLTEPVLLRTRRDSLVPIDDCASPIVERDGSISGAVVAFRDVRDRRTQEERVRRAEEQLRQAQKMEAIGRLAGGIAHDFNNLLTVISSATEMLMDSTSVDAQARELVDEIDGATERASSLTRQLLSFGRKQILQPEVVDVNALVGSLNRMLRRLISEDIELELSLSVEPVVVKVDPRQLEQVLMNLVINARDAMPGGGRLVIATDAPEELPEALVDAGEGTSFVRLLVRDSGEGMPHDVALRAFEPFFTTKGKGKGTGLGLATVHGIVTQSGGHVELDSRVGEGTTISIYLPSVDAPVLSSHRTRAGAPRGGETVLLVDDEDGVRLVAQATLKRHGYRVITARDGGEAWALFRSRVSEIDIVVTDVVMPGKGGRELAEDVTALRPGLPVLFLSGYADDTLIRHGVEEGAADLLQKPFLGSELARKVREVLDRRAAGGIHKRIEPAPD